MEAIRSIEHKPAVIECREIGANAVQLRLPDDMDPNQIIPELQQYFDDLYKRGIANFILDMANVAYPNGSFIAMLIAETMLARRRGGDLRLVNIPESAKNHLSIFSPLTYLTLGFDTVTPIDDLQEASPSLYTELFDYEEGEITSLDLPASIDSLQQITDFVGALAQKAGMEKTDLGKLKIAVYECCMNVIEHGYENGGGKIAVEAVCDHDDFKVTIIDWGKSFDINQIKPYDVSDAFKEKRRGGFGMYMIRQSVDDIEYCADGLEGNRLTLIKHLG